MRFENEVSRAASGRPVLYRVPDRRLARAPHAPVGRTLHLIDIENLAGGSDASPELLDDVVRAYRCAAPVSPGDHVIIAAGSRLAFAAGAAWPGARLVVGHGVDGADRALLAQITDVAWVTTRFDRVVLGSGDGIFTDALATIRAMGIATGIIANARRFSWMLQQQAAFVRVLPSDFASQRTA